jgi:predicted dehydrogenase
VFHGYLETEAFIPEILRARKAVEDGAIGKVLIVRSREAHTGSHAAYAWDAATSGGGPLLGMGVHAVAACRIFIGKDVMPQEVMCWADTLEHDVPFEDNAVALIRFENRALGQIEAGWSNHGGMDVRTEIYGSDGLIHIDATHGVPMKAFSMNPMGYVQEKADMDTGWTFPQADEAWQYGYHGQMYHFVRCLEDGTPADETFEDGYIANAVIDAAYRSAKSRAWEPVDLEAVT